MKDSEEYVSPYLTKDAFYDFVLDNRDRQDANKQEIIDTLTVTIAQGKLECDKDIETVGKRVTKLEDGARKQTVVVATIASIGTIIGTAITGTIAYFAKFGG